MTTPNEAAQAVAATEDWNARVALIRKVPEHFGTAQHTVIYSTIARKAYIPLLAPDFAYVHWLDDYELQPIQESYAKAYAQQKASPRWTRIHCAEYCVQNQRRCGSSVCCSA